MERKMEFRKINLKFQVVGIALFIFSSIPMIANALPAFPGAQGFGSNTIGGRGGTLCKVTNTNDSGSGSFRACLTASGPRIVIFTVGGTINLSSPISISNPYITIAGQTAPGGGIQLNGSGININTHDVIMRGLRVRDYSPAVEGAVSMFTGAYNIILDHNSFQYAEDQPVTFWYNPYNVTVSWNIVAFGCQSPAFSAGMLIGGYDACQTPGNSISIHHNLFAHNGDRSPLIKQKLTAVEIINNVVYNWDYYGGRTFAESSWIKNQYIAGPNTRSSKSIFVQNGGECPSLPANSVFLSHNIGPGRTTDTGDDWLIADGSATYRANSSVFTLSGVTETDVSALKSAIIAANGVGAYLPSRDSLDALIIGQVNAGSGGSLINTPSGVICSGCTNGVPSIAIGTYPTDTDGDGMPDSWESTNGTNPSVSDANGDVNGDGYTNIEKYINSFFTTNGSPPPPPPPSSLVPNPPTIMNIQ